MDHISAMNFLTNGENCNELWAPKRHTIYLFLLCFGDRLLSGPTSNCELSDETGRNCYAKLFPQNPTTKKPWFKSIRLIRKLVGILSLGSTLGPRRFRKVTTQASWYVFEARNYIWMPGVTSNRGRRRATIENEKSTWGPKLGVF